MNNKTRKAVIQNQQTQAAQKRKSPPIPPMPIGGATENTKNDTASSTDKLEERKEPYWQKQVRNWSIVVCTIFLTFYTARLYYVATSQTDRSIAIAERNMTISNRAYVVIGDVKISKPILNQWYIITYSITNVGATPAYRINFVSSVFVGNNVDSSISYTAFDNADIFKPDSGYVLGSKIIKADTLKLPPIEKRQMDSLQAGSFSIFFTGKIEYSDIFNAWHRTHFNYCFSYRWNETLTYRNFNNAD